MNRTDADLVVVSARRRWRDCPAPGAMPAG